MNRETGVSLRVQTITVLAVSLLLFHLVSLVLFVYFSASTATLAREEQLAQRIATVTGFMEGVPATYRDYLAAELSGPGFEITIGTEPVSETIDKSSDSHSDNIAGLVDRMLRKKPGDISTRYQTSDEAADMQAASVIIQRIEGLFNIQETLLVSVALTNGTWLNFRTSGSTWGHILSASAIPSLSLMAIGVILLAAWAVNRPLRSLSRFALASETMGRDVLGAQPLDEQGPRELRDAARAFNRMQRQVQRLLQSRNQMLGAVSHDFRTPLTRLRLRAESIVDDTQRDKAIRDIEEMEQMIALTLAYARDDSVEEAREPLELDQVIESVIESMDCRARCDFRAATPGLIVECQRSAMRRVIQNIIENALNYAGELAISTGRDASGITIDFDDAGPGIAEDQREKVFLPFYRVESSRNRASGGAGFGLAIAQTVVEAHGGRISMQTSPQGGLRVHIVLPAALQYPGSPAG